MIGYTLRMATSDLKSLPLQARRRIERLEATVSELTGKLDRVVAEMRRQAQALPLRGMGSSARKAVPATGLAAALARSEGAKVEWIRSGEVVPARTLAENWGLTPQALGPAAERGEVFAIVVKRQRYYPKEFLDLAREDVGAVSKALGRLAPEEKLVFWKRPHGARGGKTVAQLLGGNGDGKQLARVLQLARTWSAGPHSESDGAEAV